MRNPKLVFVLKSDSHSENASVGHSAVTSALKVLASLVYMTPHKPRPRPRRLQAAVVRRRTLAQLQLVSKACDQDRRVNVRT